MYRYKDHLGNVRLSYDKTLAIKEENNYYPFGLKQEGYNIVKTGIENKYKYNGKELNEAPSTGSAIKLSKTMEAEAPEATKLIIGGKGVFETKLLNAQAWERLGYTIDRIGQHFVRIYKNL